VLNWEGIARAETHPLRLAILEQLLSAPPNHMRLLRQRGWLVELDSRQVREAVQTFYRLSDAAVDG
jgi:hypothetical protein